MKKWYLVDECEVSKGGFLDIEELDAPTKEEAIGIATVKWEKMSRYDQKRRDAFYVCYAESDEDGFVDLDTATDQAEIK